MIYIIMCVCGYENKDYGGEPERNQKLKYTKFTIYFIQKWFKAINKH